MSDEQQRESTLALSAKMPVVTWPPPPGARITLNSGWPSTSWEAEVRSEPIDAHVVVVRWTCGRRREHGLLTRLEVLAFTSTSNGTALLRLGRMPPELRRMILEGE